MKMEEMKEPAGAKESPEPTTDFESCCANGGKISVKGMSGGRNVRICSIGGKTYTGPTKTAKMAPANKGAFLRASKKML